MDSPAPLSPAGIDARIRDAVTNGVRPITICNDLADHGVTPADVLGRIDALQSGDGLTPIEQALFVLAGMARPDGASPGGYRLRGRPADIRMVIKEANKSLRHLRKSSIDWPGV